MSSLNRVNEGRNKSVASRYRTVSAKSSHASEGVRTSGLDEYQCGSSPLDSAKFDWSSPIYSHPISNIFNQDDSVAAESLLQMNFRAQSTTDANTQHQLVKRRVGENVKSAFNEIKLPATREKVYQHEYENKDLIAHEQYFLDKCKLMFKEGVNADENDEETLNRAMSILTAHVQQQKRPENVSTFMSNAELEAANIERTGSLKPRALLPDIGALKEIRYEPKHQTSVTSANALGTNEQVVPYPFIDNDKTTALNDKDLRGTTNTAELLYNDECQVDKTIVPIIAMSNDNTTDRQTPPPSTFTSTFNTSYVEPTCLSDEPLGAQSHSIFSDISGEQVTNERRRALPLSKNFKPTNESSVSTSSMGTSQYHNVTDSIPTASLPASSSTSSQTCLNTEGKDNDMHESDSSIAKKRRRALPLSKNCKATNESSVSTSSMGTSQYHNVTDSIPTASLPASSSTSSQTCLNTERKDNDMHESDSAGHVDSKQIYKPKRATWNKRYEDAKKYVENTNLFSKKEEKRVKQWIYNLKRTEMDEEMRSKAWDIGIYTMYTNDQMIEKYNEEPLHLACTNWKKFYIQRRGSFSEGTVRKLIENKVYTADEIKKPIRTNRKRDRDSF